MPSLSDVFQRSFQQTLGKPFGFKLATPEYHAPASMQASLPRVSEVKEQIRQGVIDLPSSIEKGYENVFGERATGGTGGGLLEKILKGTEKHVQQQIRKDTARLKVKEPEILEKNRIKFAAALQEARAKGAEDTKRQEIENYTKQWRARGESPEKAAMYANMQYDSIEGKSIGEQLHLPKDMFLGRPQQALFGAVMGLTGGADNKKAGLKLDIPGLFKGAAKGVTSSEPKYSGGGIIERVAGKAPRALKTAGGFGLDFFADPLTYTGLGLEKFAPELNKIMDAEGWVNRARQVATNTVDEAKQAGVDLARRAKNGSALATQKFAEQNVIDQVTRDVSQQLLDVRKGGKAGKWNWGEKRSSAATVAERAANAARDFRFNRFDDFVEQWKAHAQDVRNGGQGLLSKIAIDNMRAIDAHFDDFLNRVQGLKPSAIKAAEDAVRASYSKDTQTLAEILYKNLKEGYTHVPVVKLGGKSVRIPFIGKAMAWGDAKVAEGALGGYDEIRKLSHAGMFPGKLAITLQRRRAIGIEAMQRLEKEVADMATEFDHKERKLLTELREGQNWSSDPHLQRGLDFLDRIYKGIADDEIKWGVRPDMPHQLPDNYTYVWMKSAKKDAVARFKSERKKQIKRGGGAAGYNTAAAKAKGLRPVEDAFEALLKRQMKANRDLTKAMFRHDVIDQYGHAARGLPDFEAKARKLEQIPLGNLSEELLSKIKPQLGDRYYLPQTHADTLNNLNELSKFSTDNIPMKVVRKITNFFRAGATLYNPGYHIRNQFSDVMMGLLDNVDHTAYGEMMAKMTFDKRGGEKIPRPRFRRGATFKIGDRVLTTDQFRDLFFRYASGGGFTPAHYGEGGRLIRGASAVQRGVRGFSEVRENFPRMVHFLSALRQEYKAQLKNLGRKSADEAFEKAAEAAVYRVNHYKFDYGALTRWEQKTIKPIVPFYTFTRKAFPTIMESFMTHPKWLHRYQMLRQSFDANENNNFQGFEVPQWMKDVGYATISDEKDHAPWMMTMDPMPTSVIGNVIPPDKSLPGLAHNVLEQVNPLGQMIIELNNKRQLFSGKPIDNPLTYIAGKFGGPLTSAESAYEQQQKGLKWWQVALQSRLGAGLPIRKLTEDIRFRQAKAWEDKNIQEPFDKFNKGEGAKKGIYISPSLDFGPGGKSSYKVKDAVTGEVLYQGVDPAATLTAAKILTTKNKSIMDTMKSSWKGVEGEAPKSLNDWNDSVGYDGNIRIYRSERKDGTSYRVKNTKTDEVIHDSKSLKNAFQWANRKAISNAAGKPKKEEPSYQQDVQDYLGMQGQNSDSYNQAFIPNAPAGMARGIPGMRGPGPTEDTTPPTPQEIIDMTYPEFRRKQMKQYRAQRDQPYANIFLDTLNDAGEYKKMIDATHEHKHYEPPPWIRDVYHKFTPKELQQMYVTYKLNAIKRLTGVGGGSSGGYSGEWFNARS